MSDISDFERIVNEMSKESHKKFYSRKDTLLSGLSEDGKTVKFCIKETQKDRELAAKSKIKIQKNMCMNDAVRRYFAQSKSATFRCEKAPATPPTIDWADGDKIMACRGKGVDGTEYIERVTFMTKEETSTALRQYNITTLDELLKNVVVFWNVLKHYGCLQYALNTFKFK